MNRLWVRFSLTISGFFLVLILLPLGTAFILNQLNIIDFQDEGPAGQDEDDFSPRDLSETLVNITAVVGAIGVGLGVWLSRGLSAPIVELVAAAKQIGAGDLSQRVPVPTYSRELVDLAQSFNEMAAELQRAETLRSTLLADVSHELRIPLTALSGQLRAGLDHVYELDEEEIANLYGQTQHLIRLVEDLHLLAQAEAQELPLQLATINLPSLWQEISANFAVLAEEKGVIFTVLMADNLPDITADPGRLRQIFTNLLANALRHTPSGGVITIQGSYNQAIITITIEDTGNGISLEHLPHLFDRFYRTDSSRSRDTGGSGLGLAIVKAIVEGHKGKITVSSPGIDKGSTFTLRFPTA